jgi:integrase
MTEQYTPTWEEIKKLVEAASDGDQVLLVAYLETGARRSEVFRWRWGPDINFESRRVRLGTRKTKDRSMRYEWMSMSDDLYNSLMWLYENRKVKSEYVFVCTSENPSRRYGKPSTARRTFMKNLCVRAGVNHFGFHALRRFVASSLADAPEISLKQIQELLRHKHPTTTDKHIKRIRKDQAGTVSLLNLSHKVNIPPAVPPQPSEKQKGLTESQPTL